MERHVCQAEVGGALRLLAGRAGLIGRVAHTRGVGCIARRSLCRRVSVGALFM